MRLPASRRVLAAVTSVAVASTLIAGVVFPEAARAAGPSVGLPDTPQTTIAPPASQSPRPPDQATTAALHGNQPASSTPPPAGGGTATASPLSPSATWQVSPHTGDFTWSYPLRVPPAAGGLEPELSLSYASSSVDGRTSATNNQASWAGDGWDLSTGFIERVYGGCAGDDMGGTTPPRTGDLCWRNDNAMSTTAGMLIHETGNRWRAKSDDGTRIERLEGAGNGDDNGEHWKVTTVEGVQYFYGSRPESQSTWTVPVYGDDAEEPCHGATFEASRCTQAWRWNLDKVIDPFGNMMVYTYEVEGNRYGANQRDDGVAYIRGGNPRLIEYGLRLDGATAAGGQVEFFTEGRCVPGSECVQSRKDNWPDVQWASQCDSATCAGNHAPTFWTSKRLKRVVTRVRGAGGFTDVDSWTLEHQFPSPGGLEKAALWLKSIVHTGHVGGEIALPAVTFEGTAMPNRVMIRSGTGPLNRYRITGVVSETGGTIAVVYAEPDCVDGVSMPPSPEHNTMRCYPVFWAPAGADERLEYFHKYVVEAVVESDRYEGTSEQRTSYVYAGGAAWHYDTSEFARPDRKTWSDFRGFGRVRVRTGNPGDPAGPVGETERRFYRGMHDDPLPGNGRRTVNVADSRGGSRADSDWLAGHEFETARLNGVDGSVVETTITTPVAQGPNASRGDVKSYLVRNGASETHVALAGQAWRSTRVETSYDDRGQVLEIDDSGDLSTSEDDQCTRKRYTRNESQWIISLPYRVWTVAVRCAATPSMPDDSIGDTRTGYDGLAVEAAPTAGTVTRTEELAEPGYVVTATAEFDAHGRQTSSWDALGKRTRTAYTPELGGPLTRTVVTNPLGHATSTTIAPQWGQPVLVVDPNLRRTETTHDALGRVSAVWQPNRKRGNGETASATHTYLIRRDGPTVVTTASINALGGYTTTKRIYDPLARLRQIQAPASGGGRLLTDTRYDSQGRAYFTSQPYFHNSELDDNLWVASEVDKLGATMTEFDGAGRTVATAFRGGGSEKWRTVKAYEGDRVRMTPPQGGTPVTTLSDAQGRTVEIQQGSTPDITRYAYTKGGDLASIVDAMGNTWRYHYDMRGNLIRTEDPDKGTSTMEYDAAGQLVTSTDARGIALRYEHDDLGRQTSLSHNGNRLASWRYDTALFGKGQLAASTRHMGQAAYTTTVGSYNHFNQPVSVTVTIPEQEQTLAGSYTSELRYDYDGGLASQTLPAIGGLPAEGVVHERDALGLPKVTRGGYNGVTYHYVTDSVHTRQGELARIQYGEGEKRAWQSLVYDQHTRRLAQAVADVEAPAPMQADVRYTYDPAGNITSIVDQPLERTPDGQCFRYDYLRRLTHAWTPREGCGTDPGSAPLDGPAPYRHAYTYDKAGNRLTATTDAVTSTYRYPSPGSARPHAVTSVSVAGTSESYAYDAVGNTTTRPGQSLEWDAEGHVGKVTGPDGETTFVYDAGGERLIRRTPDATTLYLDGQELTLDRGTGSLTPARFYTHGGKTIAVRTPAKLTWLMGDHQGTTQIAVDSDTMAVIHRRQTPFGLPRGTPAAIAGEKGFVGGTRDASTGMLHIGAREYDAGLGRFISVDPVMGSEPQLMNAYAYSNNSPVTFSDPTGLYCDSCEYYDYTKGEESKWSLEVQSKSFCDSCEYYANRDGTKSAWKPRYYSPKLRPSVFAQSEEINKRRAEEERKRREAEEEERRRAECGFWCKIGNRLKAVTNSAAFKWIGVGLSVMALFGCVACGMISIAMSAIATGVSCATGDAGECAAGVGTLALGGLAAGVSRSARHIMWSGADRLNRAAAIRNTPLGSGGLVRKGGLFVKRAVHNRTVAGVGHLQRGAAAVVRGYGYMLQTNAITVDSMSAIGLFRSGQ